MRKPAIHALLFLLFVTIRLQEMTNDECSKYAQWLKQIILTVPSSCLVVTLRILPAIGESLNYLRLELDEFARVASAN